MRKITPKQSALATFFLDGVVNLALVLPWFKQLIDNMVDYYRHLLLRGKTLHCPVCLALYVVKNGKKLRMFGSPVQSYLCMNCRKQFCANIFHKFYRHKYPVCFILLALDLKKKGNPISEIMSYIFVPFLISFLQPCYATLTRWIRKFGSIAVEAASKIKLMAGRKKHWEIDEQYDSRIVKTNETGKYVKKGKKKAGTFGVFDPFTKLISLESFDFNLNKKAKSTILRTQTKWQRKPRCVWRDGFNGYDKILKELGIPYGTVIHCRGFKSKKGYHDNGIEREWSSKREWIKKCRGFASFKSRSFYDKFYEISRNFFTPRSTLLGLTPAEKAGVKENISFLGLME